MKILNLFYVNLLGFLKDLRRQNVRIINRNDESGMMKRKESVKKALIRNLMYMDKWGGSHTSFSNLPKGFPSHLRGEVKEIARELIKKGILLSKPTSYRLEVSLNVDRKKEIEAMLAE